MLTQLEEEFINLCYEGKYTRAKKLYLQNPNINIFADDEIVFHDACELGNLNFVKWLFEINPNINIMGYDNFAFTISCECGYLNLAKWLSKIMPTVNISFIYTFGFICDNKDVKIAKYILQQSLQKCYKYYIFVIKNTIQQRKTYNKKQRRAKFM